MTRKHARLTALPSRIRTADLTTAKAPPKKADPIYLTSEWRGLVASIIRERGRRCEDCGRTDCRLVGDHVHELKDGGAPLDRANVRLRCGACHQRKTAAVRAERMARRYTRADRR